LVLNRLEGRLAVGTTGQPYVSGNWVVKEGSEAEFVERWRAFTEWSLANGAGAERFVLLRDAQDLTHFVSFGAWQTRDGIDAWRASTGFQERLAACRALCEDFKGTDYSIAAEVA
jgi:heme-degrading monooxygenase HmoA